MTALDLDAIKVRHDEATAFVGGDTAERRAARRMLSAADVPALVAEVKRLRADKGVRDSIVILNASLSGARDELWEKRDDPYFLGKHDGVSAALARLKRIVPPESSVAQPVVPE